MLKISDTCGGVLPGAAYDHDVMRADFPSWFTISFSSGNIKVCSFDTTIYQTFQMSFASMEAEKSEAKFFEYYSKSEKNSSKYSFSIKTNGKAQEKAFTAYEVSVRRLRSRAELEPQFEDSHGDQVLEVRVEIYV